MPKKLFSTPKTLFEGYCDLRAPYHLDNDLSKAKAGESRRKVYLMGRVLKSGNISLFRYAFINGKKIRESLGVVLYVETSYTIKTENENKLRLQALTCDRINDDLIRQEADYAPKPKTSYRITDHIKEMAKESLEKTENRHSNFATYSSLAKHIEECFSSDRIGGLSERLEYKYINEDWLRLFIHYLKNDAKNLNFTRTEDEARRDETKRLSQNTQHRIIANLTSVLKDAVKKGYLKENPLGKIDKSEKIKAETGTRVFLSVEEVNKLRETPFTHSKFDIKEAFLFACFVGLRYSDLKALRFSNFQEGKEGRKLCIRMKKTGKKLDVYVPNAAFNLLRKDDGREYVFSLPKNDYANECLAKWVKDAGLTKKVTFHVARHTAATVLLSNGLPIANVQSQLGHTKSQTTEVYAKLLEEAKKQAASTMDRIYNK